MGAYRSTCTIFRRAIDVRAAGGTDVPTQSQETLYMPRYRLGARMRKQRSSVITARLDLIVDVLHRVANPFRGEHKTRSHSGCVADSFQSTGAAVPKQHGGLSPNYAPNGVQTSHSSADRNESAVTDISSFGRPAFSWRQHISDIGADAKSSGCSASAGVLQ